ncbi:MAG: hypothetical protein AB7S38_36300 [Vulcanimicrobiota bacterium]
MDDPLQSPNLLAMAEALEAWENGEISDHDYVGILAEVRESVRPVVEQLRVACADLPEDMPADMVEALLECLRLNRAYLQAFDEMIDEPHLGLDSARAAVLELAQLEQETREKLKQKPKVSLGDLLDSFRTR